MAKTVIKIENMNISYGDKVILKDGNFHVDSGEFVLILGENGSGKSSIFRSVIGEDSQKTSRRDMYFNGAAVDGEQALNNFRRAIGYARQEDDPDSFFSRSVWNYIYDYARLSCKFDGCDKKEILSEMQKVYDELQCGRYADGKLKSCLLKKCSGGEKRMATILSALSRTQSDLFILDEPINNLDAVHARLLNNYLIKIRQKDNAPGILVITHCHMFQKVDRVYKLSKGILTEISDYAPKSCYGECDACGLYMEE